MQIMINKLSHHYGTSKALKNVTLTLPRGFTLLLGPNGAGKSTLFGLLTGLQKIEQGDITFDGQSLHHSRNTIMANMGVVFQQNTLDIDLTVQQNLSYFASLHGISEKKALQRISTLLEKLELKERLSTKVRNLNGGHRRRVELARCLIHNPSILLLDEPTVGLDMASRQLILSVVKNLTQQRPMSVLWATHLFEEVHSDDHLVILFKGSIVSDDICSTLLSVHKQPNIDALWQHLITENQ
jgi:ABC-2 type transport system ATP-binding protein